MEEKKKSKWLGILLEVLRILLSGIAGAGGAAAGIV